MNPEDLERRLARWRDVGLITGSQADAIRAYERSRPRRPQPPPEPPRPEPPRPAPPAPPPSEARTVRSAPNPFAPLVAEQAEPLVSGLPVAPDGRLVGVFMLLLAAVGIVIGIFSVTLDILVAPTHNVPGDVEDVLHLAASLLGALGGYQMATGRPAGRRLVLLSLGINVVATLVLSLGHLAQGGPIFDVALWLVLATIVAAARFGPSARNLEG